jgi:UDP-2,3-diacylglucosamine pyrophosphatase LpxH
VKRLWVLADPHAGVHPEADRALLALLDRAAGARADLLLLGDLFHAWIAHERFWSAFQRNVLESLVRLRGRGHTVLFVAGNRDYLSKDLEGSIFDRVLEGEARIDLGGIATFVAHGDRLNRDDHLYRLWHRVSRSTLATALVRRLPGSVGRRLAEETESRLAGTNLRYKSGELPLEALSALGRRARASGAHRALVGHFHHDRVLEVPDGVPVIVAPGWFEHQRVLVPDPDGGALRSVPVTDL